MHIFFSKKIYFGILKVDAIGHIWANLLYCLEIKKDYPILLFYRKKDLCNKRALLILKDTLPKNYEFISLNKFNFLIIRVFIKILRLIPYQKKLKVIDSAACHLDNNMIEYGSRYRYKKFEYTGKLNYSRSVISRKKS